jgi:hypothetical protein
MHPFKFLKGMRATPDIEDQPYPEAAQDAARNYADLSAKRRERAPLESLPPEGLVLKSEPNLNILESDPGVRQLSPGEVEAERKVSELSPEEVAELLRLMK